MSFLKMISSGWLEISSANLLSSVFISYVFEAIGLMLKILEIHQQM
jgi:hypothetical protein